MSFCLYNKKNITRWLEDMIVAKTIFYSLAALVRKILFCHSKIKFISSRPRVISSIYTFSVWEGSRNFDEFWPHTGLSVVPTGYDNVRLISGLSRNWPLPWSSISVKFKIDFHYSKVVDFILSYSLKLLYLLKIEPRLLEKDHPTGSKICCCIPRMRSPVCVLSVLVKSANGIKKRSPILSKNIQRFHNLFETLHIPQ